MSAPEGLITVSEAARRLGRSIEQVRRYLREGKLPGRRIGQQWFIDEASLPQRYQASRGGYQRVREPAAVLEIRPMKTEELPVMTREEIEVLFRRIDERVEMIRRRLGRDLDTDIVEMLRMDREEH